MTVKEYAEEVTRRISLENKSESEDSVVDIMQNVERFNELFTEDVFIRLGGFTELAAAEVFADLYKNKLVFCSDVGAWYYYDGIVWREDKSSVKADELAIDFAKIALVYNRKYNSNDTDKSEKFKKYFIDKYSKIKSLRNLLEASKNKMCINYTDFDKNTHLLNCLNVVVNLKTLEVMEHSPQHYCTKCCNVLYDPDAKSQLWDNFIDDITYSVDRDMKDGDKKKYLQKAIAYGITGEPVLERMFILYGATTRNGKSTLIETLKNVLGDYALNTLPETLAIKINKDSRQASEDIARLAGCRFLVCSEPQKNMILDVALIKQLTGNDTISARKLYQSTFEFKPQFSLFMNTNYLPKIQDDTVFSSNRISVITFERHFDEKSQDSQLKNKLGKENVKSAVLNWILDGLAAYKIEGLEIPQTVRIATREYEKRSDKIQQFLDDVYEEDASSIISLKEVYSDYQMWCNDNRYGIEGKQRFTEMCKNKMIFKERGTISSKTVKNVICGYIKPYSEG